MDEMQQLFNNLSQLSKDRSRLMDYDRWLEAPYEAAGKAGDRIERIADELASRPQETFYEFLQWFVEETDDEQIINAVRQHDFEAIGGLLYKRYEDYIWKSAEKTYEHEL